MDFFVGYLGLIVGGPPETGLEASGAGYARRPVVFGALGDGSRSAATSLSYSFGVAEADWGVVTGLALYPDALASSSPVAVWGTRPRHVPTGTTFLVPSASLSLLIHARGICPAGETLGQASDGGAVIAGQTVSILDGVLAVAATAAAMTMSQLSSLLSQLMRALPTSDPGDGASLWSNANLLAVSVKD
ncbi:hypothetical protein [Acetobacter sp. DsW_063]|uniref:hypothetical protein n=1 Tax=Acetobacter sp. DsW_063 TaxID=1514894 RepID=UPI000A38FDB1|nr:hypothetical protein [Acetobacter sp. DsW_063]OUJ12767.1 hypothetical protein HK28_02645 [Acetobacter sp. DsW_063]